MTLPDQRRPGQQAFPTNEQCIQRESPDSLGECGGDG